MKIDFTYEMIEMEPGPNLYIMGARNDFSQLIEVIKPLAKGNGVSISLRDKINELEFVSKALSDVLLKSKEHGKILSKIKDQTVSMELDCTYWQKVVKLIEGLSISKGHQFIEFDNLVDFEEEFNVIMSSEW